MVAPVVSQQWWREHRDEVVLVHVGPGPGGAGTPVHLDLDRDLSAPATPQDGRHPLPSPEHFAQALTRAGIGDDDTVVAVDDAGGVQAARLVWMLRVTGRAAALLDGGLPEGEVPPRRPAGPSTATPRPWPAEALAHPDELLAFDGVLLDARPRERFEGAPDPLDPRPGHVPGARSLPCRESLDADGRLLPDEVLRARFAEVGVDGRTPVVAYCGSGVTACHDLVVLEHLGLGTGRLYPGSWSQWAADPARPVETGG